MKKATHKVSLLKACNGLLSGALALLGYTSCDSLGIGGETPLEYGTPYAKYEIKGKVTDRDTKTAIEGARIIVKPMQWKSDETFPPQAFDTLQTDKDGNYLYQNEMTMTDRYRVVCEDPSGTLKADSAIVEMDPQGGEGWYQGSDSQEVNFELEKRQQP